MSAPAIDLSTWYPQSEAAAMLGVSEKTLERMVKRGAGPQWRKRQRPGKKPENVYCPADVDALRAAAGTAVFSASSPAGQPSNGAVATRGDGIPPAIAAMLGVFERMATMAQKQRQELPGPSERMWLTIAEAAGISGLSEAFLRRCVKSGALPALRDGAVKVRRADLDNLDPVSRLAKSAAGGGRS